MAADWQGLLLSATAASAVDELYLGHLAPIDLTDFGKRPLSPSPGELWEDGDADRTVYAEALLELSDLIDEVRFLTSLGAGLCWDYLERRGSAETSSPTADVPSAGADMTFPVEALALLSGYKTHPPPPSRLFVEPLTEMSGHRVLSVWFAAQLVDSALLRATAVLDRIATLLWVSSGLKLRQRKDATWILPAFSRPELKRLRARLTPSRALEECIRLTDHPLFDLAKRARDGFTHRRRIRFEGHGASPVAYGWAVYQPEEAELHHALVVAFYDQLIRPAVDHAGQLLDRDWPDRPTT